MGTIILNISTLVTDFERSFYTQPVMILLNIIFVIVGFLYGPPGRKYRVLLWYGVAALVQDGIAVYSSLTAGTTTVFKISGWTVITSAVTFVVIEFFAFFTFFYLQFEGKPRRVNIKKIRNILTVLAALVSTYFIAISNNNGLLVLIGYLSIVLSLIQLIPAVYYFYILFNEPPTKNLLREPTFWITTGIAFLHGLNIPLFLIESYVLRESNSLWFSLYIVNYVGYCFLFLLFIVSVACDKTIKRPTAFKKLAIMH